MEFLKIIIPIMVALFMVLDSMAREPKHRESIRFNRIRNSNALILIVLLSFAACQN